MELLDSNNQRRRNDNGMNSSIKSENDYNGKGRRHRKNRYNMLFVLFACEFGDVKYTLKLKLKLKSNLIDMVNN